MAGVAGVHWTAVAGVVGLGWRAGRVGPGWTGLAGLDRAGADLPGGAARRGGAQSRPRTTVPDEQNHPPVPEATPRRGKPPSFAVT